VKFANFLECSESASCELSTDEEREVEKLKK